MKQGGWEVYPTLPSWLKYLKEPLIEFYICILYDTGLDDAKKALDGAYSKLKGMGISKADFYAKCAQVAAETGRRRSGRFTDVVIIVTQ